MKLNTYIPPSKHQHPLHNPYKYPPKPSIPMLQVSISSTQKLKHMMKTLLIACLLLTAILGSNTFVSAEDYAEYCSSNCKARCAQAGVANRCLKYCRICCAKCRCVPAGTYGNKHQCPCYRDMVNSKGKPKCP